MLSMSQEAGNRSFSTVTQKAFLMVRTSTTSLTSWLSGPENYRTSRIYRWFWPGAYRNCRIGRGNNEYGTAGAAPYINNNIIWL